MISGECVSLVIACLALFQLHFPYKHVAEIFASLGGGICGHPLCLAAEGTGLTYCCYGGVNNTAALHYMIQSGTWMH